MTCVYITQQLKDNDQQVIKTVWMQSHSPEHYTPSSGKVILIVYTQIREKMEMKQKNGKDNIINGS